MTACAPPLRRVPTLSPRRLLLLALMLAVAGAVLPVYNRHAVRRHGAEAVAVRECFERNGPFNQFRSSADPNVVYQTCRLDDGRWGLQVIKWDARLRAWIEKTSFIRKDGSWSELWRYLRRTVTHLRGPLAPGGGW
jgi:hypothetical protein